MGPDQEECRQWKARVQPPIVGDPGLSCRGKRERECVHSLIPLWIELIPSHLCGSDHKADVKNLHIKDLNIIESKTVKECTRADRGCTD